MCAAKCTQETNVAVGISISRSVFSSNVPHGVPFHTKSYGLLWPRL
jgi:hypothetical protein